MDIYQLCTLYYVIELLQEQTEYSVWIDLLDTFLSAHSVWFNQRVDLLHNWTLSISCGVVQLCRLSEYFDTDIWCDWISKSSQAKDILYYRILNRSQDTDILCVDIRRITGEITGYSG